MGEASVIEMYLQALPEIVKNAADPLAQTDKIVMYGDGNATKLVKDVMHSANQVVDGIKAYKAGGRLRSAPLFARPRFFAFIYDERSAKQAEFPNTKESF